MMTIFFKHGSIKEWHISEDQGDRTDAALSLFVDGDELDYVKSRFTNLPMVPTARIVHFPQPWADFIWKNLT